ncbi:hypothetical protein Pyrde_1381 [Pyrodictium delaneyi]|uniref:DUF2202 domain-containing protein n=1 Tax=Pyrodictium delaneyi TaxID=1273541 RepID=A0A0P0N567_9CREN|nr:DUF2202 domain-containing protein [Pyrodictium delaneyi]ALL01427.1 hypothetical protein Pyrde_1381 [Pyrodictium delaneyi]OWJ54655.1 hypothetical protein Pdsh_06455 [Pyrodictium delaneyi]
MNRLVYVLIPVVLVALAAAGYVYLKGAEAPTAETTVASTTPQTMTGQSIPGGHGPGAGGASVSTMVQQLPAEPLSEDEKESLLFMVEEEKLARDVYNRLAEMYPEVQVFANIARSEQQHVDSVMQLIEKYGLEIDLGQPGEFHNQELQQLYNELVDRGSKSLEEALKVGALIEEKDIVDLKDWLAKVDNEDIKLVYENLMHGSFNHLCAFTRTLKNMLGIDYKPVLLDEETYNSIISSCSMGGPKQ